MRRKFLLWLLPASALLCGGATAGTYENARFGYIIDYPALLRPGPEPTNGDGRVFSVAGSQAEFRVFASYLSDPDDTPGAIAREAEQSCAGAPPSLRVVQPGLVAVSCVTAGAIYYQKTLIANDAQTTLTAHYPVTERRRWDAVVRSMAGSLRPATR